MAEVLTYEPTTSDTDLVRVWRKVQGDLMVGFNFMAEEYEMLDSLREFRINWSTREILVPIDLNDGVGVASIPEGGWEADPSSPTVEEIFLTWILLNKRFTATLTAQYIDQKNRGAMVRRQIVHQGKKAVQAIGNRYADYFYGFSTGVMGQASAAQAGASSHTITVTNGYGQTSITDGSFIVEKLRVGERIALVRSGSLVTNAFGLITDRDVSAGTIDVTWDGSVTIEENDNIVFANSLEHQTLAGTDFNRGLTGLLEVTTSDTVHELSRSTDNDRWDAALVDNTSARFDTISLLKIQDAIEDNGGGSLTDMLLARGVYRDMLDNQLGSLRFSDPFNLQLDGELKSRGVKLTRTKRVPPGMVFGYDRASYRKMTLLKKPTEGSAPQWGDGEKIPDRSARVFSIDFPVANVVTNRGNFTLHTAKTEQ